MTSTRRTFLGSLAGVAVFGGSIVGDRALAHDSNESHRTTSENSPETLTCSAPVAMGSPEAIMGTPMANVDFDFIYIDMMIPHHESVIALAEVAVDELGDERLVAIAEAIIETQPAEIEELKQLREKWYGDPEPAMLTEEMMSISMGMEHGGCSSEGHMDQMNADWQVEQFEEAEDKDLAFIRQVIPHHDMALQTSELALQYADQEEIREIAEWVIAGQQAEIDELQATPEA